MMHTFDNSFQISFLFRDGLIAFEKDEEEMPCIRPLLGPNKPPKPAENTSFVSRLDMTIINVCLFIQIFIFIECSLMFFNFSLEIHREI